MEIQENATSSPPRKTDLSPKLYPHAQTKDWSVISQYWDRCINLVVYQAWSCMNSSACHCPAYLAVHGSLEQPATICRANKFHFLLMTIVVSKHEWKSYILLSRPQSRLSLLAGWAWARRSSGSGKTLLVWLKSNKGGAIVSTVLTTLQQQF